MSHISKASTDAMMAACFRQGKSTYLKQPIKSNSKACQRSILSQKTPFLPGMKRQLRRHHGKHTGRGGSILPGAPPEQSCKSLPAQKKFGNQLRWMSYFYAFTLRKII